MILSRKCRTPFIVTVATVVTAIVCLGNGCGGFKPLEKSGDFASSSSAVTWDMVNSNIIQPKCIACHHQGGLLGATDFTTYAGVMTVVSPGNPLSSALYVYVSPGSPNPMPKGSVLGQQDVALIWNWISAGAPGPDGAIASTAASDTNLRLMAGGYVAGLLNDVFGPQAQNITGRFINGNYAQFGGGCDKYGSTDCPANLSQGGVIPSALTTRSSILIRTCDLIMQDDYAVTYAASKVGTIGVLPDRVAVQAAYDLFYPGRTLESAAAVDSLGAVVNQATALSMPPLEGWRFLFLTLCMSPDWQIP